VSHAEFVVLNKAYNNTNLLTSTAQTTSVETQRKLAASMIDTGNKTLLSWTWNGSRVATVYRYMRQMNPKNAR
jgi:hypothetical protein